jgi:hypothetical protein
MHSSLWQKKSLFFSEEKNQKTFIAGRWWKIRDLAADHDGMGASAFYAGARSLRT